MTSYKAGYWQTPAPVPSKFVNAALFNLSWLAIVLTHSSLLAPTILVVHLLAHFRFMGRGRGELYLIAAVTVLGACVDQVLFRTGVFNLAGQPALAPLWLTCLWPVFATTLMHTFAGFQHRILFAVIFGAVGGALSYTAGVRLTAVEFGSPLWGPVILGALWAVVFPLLLMLSARCSSPGDPLQAWTPAERRAFD
jgi:Protein of unknown function (DUF2878)